MVLSQFLETFSDYIREKSVWAQEQVHRGHTEIPSVVWRGRSYSWNCQRQSPASAIHSGCK